MTRHWMYVACAMLLVAHLSGCATAAKPQAMVVHPSTSSATINETLRNRIRVSGVTGGQSTNPLWTSKVDNASFKEALEKSLRIAGYLATADSDASHVVSVTLKKLEQPFIGGTFKVVSNVDYRVESPDGEQVLPITATGVATMGDALIGMTRLRIANENSINENIKMFLRELSTY